MPGKEIDEASAESRGIEGGKPDDAARGLAAAKKNDGVAAPAAKAQPPKKLKNAPPVEHGLRYLGDAETKPDPYGGKTKEYPRLVLTRLGGPAFVQYKKVEGYTSENNFEYFYKDGMEYCKGKDTANPVRGYRSKLVVEIDSSHQKSFDAMERAWPFTSLRPTTPERVYVVAMRARSGHPHELVVTGTNVLIHKADLPMYLEGCIAPGTAPNVKDGGILHSQEALNEIIDLLGGWEWTLENKKEKPARLLVHGFQDIPG